MKPLMVLLQGHLHNFGSQPPLMKACLFPLQPKFTTKLYQNIHLFHLCSYFILGTISKYVKVIGYVEMD